MTGTIVKSVRMSADLWAFVAQRAKANNINVNAWMIRCVKDARKQLERADVQIGPTHPKPGSRLKA